MEAFSVLVTFTEAVFVSPLVETVAVAVAVVPVAPVHAYVPISAAAVPALQPDTVQVTVTSPFLTSGFASSTVHSHPVTGVPCTSTFPEQSCFLPPTLMDAL